MLGGLWCMVTTMQASLSATAGDSSVPAGGATVRAIVTGMVIGGLLAPCNVYSGLKIGWSFNMSIIALLLASASGPVMAQAFQGAPSVDFGGATINAGTPGAHTIIVDTPRATITWTPSDSAAGGGPIDFLPNGNTVNYVANGSLGSNYTVLNRILPVDSSRSVALMWPLWRHSAILAAGRWII